MLSFKTPGITRDPLNNQRWHYIKANSCGHTHTHTFIAGLNYKKLYFVSACRGMCKCKTATFFVCVMWDHLEFFDACANLPNCTPLLAHSFPTHQHCMLMGSYNVCTLVNNTLVLAYVCGCARIAEVLHLPGLDQSWWNEIRHCSQQKCVGTERWLECEGTQLCNWSIIVVTVFIQIWTNPIK